MFTSTKGQHPYWPEASSQHVLPDGHSEPSLHVTEAFTGLDGVLVNQVITSVPWVHVPVETSHV